MFCQVFPPSTDLYAPSPHEELWRLFGSPVPTHTTDGSDGAIAMSPIVDSASLSNTGVHVVPLFVVFHTPPAATPTKTIFGLLSTTAKSSMRPPITAGPISRSSRLFNLSMGFRCDNERSTKQPRGCCELQNRRHSLHDHHPSHCAARHHTLLPCDAHPLFAET